jgi:hypothetical protein
MLTKLFILFSLLLTITFNATPLTLDIADNTNDIEVYSDYPFNDGALE